MVQLAEEGHLGPQVQHDALAHPLVDEPLHGDLLASPMPNENRSESSCADLSTESQFTEIDHPTAEPVVLVSDVVESSRPSSRCSSSSSSRFHRRFMNVVVVVIVIFVVIVVVVVVVVVIIGVVVEIICSAVDGRRVDDAVVVVVDAVDDRRPTSSRGFVKGGGIGPRRDRKRFAQNLVKPVLCSKGNINVNY